MSVIPRGDRVVTVEELVSLIPVLITTFGVVLGAVALVTGWDLFSDRRPRTRRRGVVVSSVGVIERSRGGTR